MNRSHHIPITAHIEGPKCNVLNGKSRLTSIIKAEMSINILEKSLDSILIYFYDDIISVNGDEWGM